MKVDAIQATPMVGVRLFHSRKKLKKKLRKEGFDFELSDAPGQTIFFEDENGLSISVVLLEYDTISEPVLALLAHEAVHVAQGYFEGLSEDNPSSEFEAYVIQHISQYLFEAHFEWVEKHSK